MISKATLVMALVLLAAVATSMGRMGGLSEEKPTDEHVKKILSSVKDSVRGQYQAIGGGGDLLDIEPISYKTQVVAGMNYFVRAIATEANGTKKHIHVRVYKTLEGKTQLTTIKTDVGEESPLEYFQ